MEEINKTNSENVKKKKKKKPFTIKKDSFVGTLRDKRILSLTASWVFYFILSIVPLMFLLITAFSFFGVDLSMELAGRLPMEFREAGEVIVGTASNVSKSVTFLFIITVLLSCSSLLNQMSRDGDYIYGETHKKRSGILGKLWVILMVFGLFLLFTAFAFLFSFKNVLLIRLGVNLKNFITAISFIFIILFGYAVILLLQKFISPKKLKVGALALSSFVSLSIVVLGTIFLILYIRFFANYNAFYGSLAGIVVFFLWSYVVMFGLLFGVFVCMNLSKDKLKVQKKMS